MTIDELLGPILQAGRPLTLKDSTDTLPSWDSARQVEVILAVEEAVGRDLTAIEIDRLKSIYSIVELLRASGIDVEPKT
jgi:acyl carrier protein